MSTEEVLSEVMKDKVFYETSGGGVTVSGGEPLYSFDFTLELLMGAKERGLNTAIETSGLTSGENISLISPFVDLFLFDCKETDPSLHKEYVGADNSLILSNLELLDSLGAHVILRCPIIPSKNDRREHLLGIAALAERLGCVEAVEIEPYHPLGEGKAESLGKDYKLRGQQFPEKEAVESWLDTISENTKKPVRKG